MFHVAFFFETFLSPSSTWLDSTHFRGYYDKQHTSALRSSPTDSTFLDYGLLGSSHSLSILLRIDLSSLLALARRFDALFG